MLQRSTLSGDWFDVRARDLEFYERVSPTVGGTKLLIPPPTLTPDERQQRRLAFRNERFLYRSSCAISGKPIISVYSPDKPFKVCSLEAWRDVDNEQFGRPYNFSRPFFEQFAELYRDTYKACLIQSGEMLNSEYAQFAGWLKNCYLVFDIGKSEDCLYCAILSYCKDCLDCFQCHECELCFDSVQLYQCYQLFYSRYCRNCNLSAFLSDCIGCNHCLCSTNLRNKEYYVANEYVGKVRFEQLWRELFSSHFSTICEMEQQFQAILAQSPHRASRLINCENATGSDLERCENTFDSYNCWESKDCSYIYDMFKGTRDCYDISTFGENINYCYELSGCGAKLDSGEVSNCFFSTYIYYGGFNILYSVSCHENSENLFGCCDVRKKSYAILNKQYTQQEYENLVPKIVEQMRNTGEWGEFFPMRISPFGYNESLAHEYFPLDPQGAQKVSARWSDYEAPAPETEEVIPASALVDQFTGNDPRMLRSAIECLDSKKPFRVLKRELDFYTWHGLPLPRYHPERRHLKRLTQLNPRKLSFRRCARCNEEISSIFSTERGERIFCERCFLQETN